MNKTIKKDKSLKKLISHAMSVKKKIKKNKKISKTFKKNFSNILKTVRKNFKSYKEKTRKINKHKYDSVYSKWNDSQRIKYKKHHEKNPVCNDKKDLKLQTNNSISKCINDNKNNNIIVIGVLTLPNTRKNSDSHIDKKYIKWLYSYGKDVKIIPIHYDSDISLLKFCLSQINGLLLTGGVIPHNSSRWVNKSIIGSAFRSRLKFIIDYITYQNVKGNYFPIFGICLGFQELLGNILVPSSIKNSINKHLFKSCDLLRLYGYHNVKSTILDNHYKDLLISPPVTSILTNDEKKYIQESKQPPAWFNSNYAWNMNNKKYINKVNKIVIPTLTIKHNNNEYMCGYQFKSLPYACVLFHPEQNRICDTKTYNKEHYILSDKLLNYFMNECKKNCNVNYTESLFISQLKPDKILNKNNKEREFYMFGKIYEDDIINLNSN